MHKIICRELSDLKIQMQDQNTSFNMRLEEVNLGLTRNQSNVKRLFTNASKLTHIKPV